MVTEPPFANYRVRERLITDLALDGEGCAKPADCASNICTGATCRPVATGSDGGASDPTDSGGATGGSGGAAGSDAGAGTGGASGSGGSDGGTGTGGGGPGTGGASGDAGASTDARTTTSSSSGCGCTTGGPNDVRAGSALLAALSLGLILGRRRRNRR